MNGNITEVVAALIWDGDQFMIGSLSLKLVLYLPGEDKEVDLDLAEDEFFSPVGLGAGGAKAAFLRASRRENSSGRRAARIALSS